ncbi:unnamed protein product [Caenorhabditis nigoni]
MSAPPRRPVPIPSNNLFREDSSDSSDSEIFIPQNNEVDIIKAGSDSDVEEVSDRPVPRLVSEESTPVEIIQTEDDRWGEEPPNRHLRNRRVSYGKIPVPPQTMTAEDIQEAAKKSREEQGSVVQEVRRPVDPRRSSVSLDVFKSFRDPHDRKNMPAKDKTIYVEGANGSFREMKKGLFWDTKEPVKAKREEKKEEDSIIPHILKAPGQAFRAQRAYNQVANIVQGFLAGVTVMLSIFSFNLDAYVLLSGYRYLSLPIHAAFMCAFTIGFVSAIDRTGIYEVEHFTSKSRLYATVYNNGLFTFVVWFVGLISTLLCIQLESQLAFAPTKIPSDALVRRWRIYNVFRAVTAALGFLLLAFKPDSDTMAKELRKAISDQMELVTHDPDRQHIILTAMKI